MNKYQLIEFTSRKKINTITSDKTNLCDVLTDFYPNTMDRIFDEKGIPKGYVIFFLNSQQLSSIQGIILKNLDEICIVTSISGG